MNAEEFGKQVQAYLHGSGYSQKQLASATAMHPKVLSRKLHGHEGSYPTDREIHDILLVLIEWQRITTRAEILDLLTRTGIEAARIFRADEWQASPLNELAQPKSAPPRETASSEQAEAPSLHNLPAPTTRLIGRTWEIERLLRLLGRDGTRLVTLVGAGGSGKTRLAQHIAAELSGNFAQGAWFVPLASVNEADLVPLSILQALNIKSAPDQAPHQSLLAFVRRKRLLLVLDNFEQVVEAGTIISEMLAAAPGLKVLTTSRIVLHLPGEYEFSVPPLDTPDPALRLGREELAHYSAIQLFVERAQAVLPDFELTDENAASLAEICASVDGLPLALELAAARIKVLPPEELLPRLSRARLPLLSRVGRHSFGRHQTLSNTIKWSYDLLSPEEQKWFRRLGVFAGGWMLESSEALIEELSASEQQPLTALTPLDLLNQLADNSLLTRVPSEHGHVRFAMLSTLREYACEQLQAHGEAELLRDWHTCYYLRKAEKGELGLHGPQQRDALARLTEGRDNLYTALEWSLRKAREGQSIHAFFPATPQEVIGSQSLSRSRSPTEDSVPALEIYLRMASALRAFWEWQGYLTEARYWLNAVLEIPPGDDAGPMLLAARARALSEYARLAVLQNEQDRALALADESIALWKQLDDPPGLGLALLHRGWALHGMGEYVAAGQAYEEGLEPLSPVEHTWVCAQLIFHRGAVAGFTSDFERARYCYERCRELFGQIGDTSAVADVWKDQGGILILAGEYEESIACLLKSIEICRELDHKQYIATALGSLSFAIGLRDEPDPETASLHSAMVQGAADRLMAIIGLTPWTRTNPLAQAVREHIRSRIDEQRWQAAWDAGHALTLEQALEMVFRLGRKQFTD